MVISGFEALHQARALLAGLELATEKSSPNLSWDLEGHYSRGFKTNNSNNMALISIATDIIYHVNKDSTVTITGIDFNNNDNKNINKTTAGGKKRKKKQQYPKRRQ
ncbi:hypothetical protein PoB_000790900 [Plakobranchus ocellatus]|uniref:Uncharacterized protein n=1 Tax=Plakobranchus ocellatus TaxID=259542 RepID=A0AAV3YEH8_9GAST|nr:hypothetical protein PoB_000790900 [Plakobranchus ocellatus]